MREGELTKPERARIRADLVLPEGIEAGLLGGLAVVFVYFMRDVSVGEPLHTPSVLGTLLLSGVEAAREVRSATGAAVVYNLVHFGMWMVVGLAGSLVMRLAQRDLRWRFLPVVAAVVWIGCLAALDGAVGRTDLARPHLWAGGLAGAIALGAFLSWRYPGALAREGPG